MSCGDRMSPDEERYWEFRRYQDLKDSNEDLRRENEILKQGKVEVKVRYKTKYRLTDSKFSKLFKQFCSEKIIEYSTVHRNSPLSIPEQQKVNHIKYSVILELQEWLESQEVKE